MGNATLSRRSLLSGQIRTDRRVMPPGFLGDRPEVCRDCTICIDHCPTDIIVRRDGWPALDFARGECTLCGECASLCPYSEVLFQVERPEFSHVVEIAQTCLPVEGVDCQACRDHCPTSAIRFRPRLGGPFLPEVDEASCTGCGACISVCPVSAIAVKFEMETAHA